MKELGYKILAAIFIVLIIASLAELRMEYKKIDAVPSIVMYTNVDSKIRLYDYVIIGSDRIGIVENITNNQYHVVFKDNIGIIIHSVYPKEKVGKVIIANRKPNRKK